ncbi:MAG: NAD-dependent DNA ligase LigA [Saccharofermentanales bacterium]|jgi:DNA ligase (NAD+)
MDRDRLEPNWRELLTSEDPATAAEAAVRVDRLRDAIEVLNHAYYDLDRPLVEDAEYDRLLRRLEDLERRFPVLLSADSPTQRVGGTPSERLQPVPHRYPMLSLRDVFSRDEVVDFVEKIVAKTPDVTFIVEMKIDGLSVGLHYEHGKLVQAVTRGDGITTGEDVTAHIRHIEAIPQTLPEPVEALSVRGEVYMPYPSFQALNERMRAEDERLFANPRNAAAGTLRQLDPAIVGERDLSFFAFDVQHASRTFTSDSKSLAWLDRLGFQTIPVVAFAETPDVILEGIDAIADARERLPFGIDGAVIKVDGLDARKAWGHTSKYPRWAVAYKYPPEEKETVILDIQPQVGRTGRLTPLAILAPVELAQTTVQRATLHNQNYIDELDCRIGDTVVVHKGGDIIPAVLRVIPSKRPPDTQPYTLPDACPVCGSATAYIGDGADLYCTGIDCPAQLVRHIAYFASKDAMDIDGLGEKAAQALVDHGFVESIADLYELHGARDALIRSGIVGREKRVDNLLTAIERSKSASLDRLVTGFGIPLVGRQTARLLVDAFGDLDALAAADEASLASIEGIGPETAHAVHDWFRQPQSERLTERLRRQGLTMTQTPSTDEAAPLANQTFVLTGTLDRMTRGEARAALEALGARVTNSVSSKTTAVIVGEAPGSKATRAEALGVPMLDEAHFRQLIEDAKEGTDR